MITYCDDIFDKKYLDEITSQLILAPWHAHNVANRNSWPYKERGSHRLLGDTFFRRLSEDNIEYNSNRTLSNSFIDAFKAINQRLKKDLRLIECSTNLQFKSMDGTFHVDGRDDEVAHILMLSNEIVENIGGEFINQTMNVTVPYKYGRVVTITASDVHRANAFNEPHIARISIKWLGEIND
jgi:hypothetical protein